MIGKVLHWVRGVWGGSWCDGMEVSQFTYFQQVCGFDCKAISGELTYGLERLAMYILELIMLDMPFTSDKSGLNLSYGDIFRE